MSAGGGGEDFSFTHANEGLGQLSTALRHQHGLRQRPRLGTSAWPYYGPQKSTQTLSKIGPRTQLLSLETAWALDVTMALGSITGYSHQALSQMASSTCFHGASTVLLLFHLSTTYLIILVAPGSSEYLGPAQESHALLVLCGTWQGSLRACSSPEP